MQKTSIHSPLSGLSMSLSGFRCKAQNHRQIRSRYKWSILCTLLFNLKTYGLNKPKYPTCNSMIFIKYHYRYFGWKQRKMRTHNSHQFIGFWNPANQTLSVSFFRSQSSYLEFPSCSWVSLPGSWFLLLNLLSFHIKCCPAFEAE